MPLHVVLVHPEIHWNTGNAGRSCLAAGATLHLIEPLGFSLDEREVRRAGLDYWQFVDLRLWPDWASFERELPHLGEPFFFSTKGTQPYWDARFPGDDAVLIFGRETGGLPNEILTRYRERVLTIPMHSTHVRSLNLSTCVGIALYEVLRQQQAASSPPRHGAGAG
ncbi:MAG TPA: tRNA (cytidine(34)-2'-O)-methyltransferase [Thermoanaerobaculia bacterium]|nr:tRNA (cytidine(34)-2'-O)-methyltransferase [Thermoanaerobaculia bacterium]